ncbi:MAG: EthD family reductase [Gammaproteobacteria bacterium]|nr:EthD family reductase [Gammaproteobacteria bacterium]
MSIFYLLEIRTNDNEGESPFPEHLEEIAVKAKQIPNLKGLNLFTPADGGHDPFLKDDGPPKLVLQLKTEDDNDLNGMLESDELINLLETVASLSPASIQIEQVALLMDPYKSCDSSKGKADISYLVNYQGPAEDETVFLKYYRENHPAILLDFPGIRRLELGLPIDWQPVANINRAERMLYCEVSFDSIEELNNALNSEVRAVLRKDYECFPPFSGLVTHFAMHRHTYL